MARRSPYEFWNDTKRPLAVVLFAYLLGISVGSMQTWLESLVAPWVIALIGLVAVLVLAVLGIPQWIIRVVSEWRSRETTRAVLVENPEEPRRGLIVFASMGPGIESAKRAIRYYLDKGKLERCWIITGGPKSEEQARSAIADLLSDPDLRFEPDMFRLERMTAEDVGNPERIREKIEEIYASLPEGWDESDVVADYTGGTASVSAGMVLACASPGRNLQYMRPLELGDDGRPVPGCASVPVLVNINYTVKPVEQKRKKQKRRS